MLNPLDIRKHEFTRAWRGYDRDEVHALLDAIAKEFETLTRQNRDLAERLREVENTAARYHQTEKTLQDAALTLQQAMEEKRRLAEQEAGSMLYEARERIAEETRAANAQIAAIRTELQALEDTRSRFYLRFQNLLREQAELLESMMLPPAEDSRRGESTGDTRNT
jgi:cell division initiation protein